MNIHDILLVELQGHVSEEITQLVLVRRFGEFLFGGLYYIS